MPEKTTKPKRRRRKNIPRWQSLLASMLLRCLRWTCRSEVVDTSDARGELQQSPCIIACWHNRLLSAPFLLPRNLRKNMVALTSPSRDGAYAAGYAREFTGNVVRGSSSRGGTRAFAELLTYLRDGHSVFITPDGPHGPRYTTQPGVILLAQKSGRPVVPAVVNCARRWELSSWDRTQIPKPFSKLQFVFGEPLYFSPCRHKVDREKQQEKLCQALLNITDDSPEASNG